MNNYIMMCPKCASKRFITTAAVSQDWEVDEKGNFIRCIDECTQTINGPDADNIWTCAKCGAEAVKAKVMI